jgi:hypothetical protein
VDDHYPKRAFACVGHHRAELRAVVCFARQSFVGVYIHEFVIVSIGKSPDRAELRVNAFLSLIVR